MSSSDITLTEKQKKAQQYLRKFHIQEILGDLLNTLAQTMSPSPIVFMIKYLSNLVSKEELEKSGIAITGDIPLPKLAITYPKFTKLNANLFKTHLTPELFFQIKDKLTPHNITLRELINIALANEEHPIGVFACDKDTYKVFAELFDQILKDVNKGLIFSEEENRKQINVPELQAQDYALTPKENEMLDQITIKVKRNLSDFTFNSYNDEAAREEIIKLVKEAFKEVDEEFLGVYAWSRLTEEATGILKDNLGMTKFNSQRPANPRFKDWPNGREIAIQKDKKYYVKINSEEHFDIVFHKNKDIDFLKDVNYVLKLLTKLEQKLKLAFDPKYGYITSNPKYIGIALRVKICIKVPEEQAHVFKTNIANWNMNYPFLAIQEIAKKGGMWRIKNTKTLGLTETELIAALKNSIHFLLASIVEAEPTKAEEKAENNKEIIAQLPEEEEGEREGPSIDYTQTEIDLTNAGITSLFRETQLNFKIRGKVGELTLDEFAKDEIEYPTLIKDDFGILANSYLIIRRNIEGLPLKGELQEHYNVQIIGFFMEFSKLLPRVFEGEVLTLSSPDYEVKAKEIIERYGLGEKAEGAEKDEKWPLGTAIYRAFNSKLIVIANLEDHLTIIYDFDSSIITNTFKEASSLVHILEKKVGSFAFQPELGYTTVNDIHFGSGLELGYKLNLHKSAIEAIQQNPTENIIVGVSNNIATLRSRNLQISFVTGLISLASSLHREEKELLYDETYKSKLEEIYPQELLIQIHTLCKTQSFSILDLFNSKLDFQFFDSKIYKELADPLLAFISSQCPKKLEEGALKNLLEAEILHLPVTCPDLVTVKVEMGRNLEKYPFVPLLSVLDKNELNDIVQGVFQNLEVEGQLLEYRDIYNVSSSLRSIFEESFHLKQENKTFVLANKKFMCWINQLDHIRLVGNVAINSLQEVIRDFETICEEFEKEGHSFLYEEGGFGHLSERLDLSGTNFGLEVQILTEKDRQILIEDIFKENKAWVINVSEGRKENQIKILLTTKGFSSIRDSFEDINTLIEVLINVHGLDREEFAPPRSPGKRMTEMGKSKSSTSIFSRSFTTPSKDLKEMLLRGATDSVENSSSKKDFVTPDKSLELMNPAELQSYFRKSLIDQERESSKANSLKKTPTVQGLRSGKGEEEKSEGFNLKKESYESPNKGSKSVKHANEGKMKGLDFEGAIEARRKGSEPRIGGATTLSDQRVFSKTAQQFYKKGDAKESGSKHKMVTEFSPREGTKEEKEKDVELDEDIEEEELAKEI